MPIIKEEIQWIKSNDFLFTTLFIWNDQYIPYQCAIFRKESNNIICGLKVYFKIEQHIFSQDWTFQINEQTVEQEKLFHTTLYIKRLLDANINQWRNIKNDSDTSDSVNEENNELLQKVFYDQTTMNLFEGTHPDFGFYTLAPNFHILKKLAKEGISPTIDEEFERLINKYKR